MRIRTVVFGAALAALLVPVTGLGAVDHAFISDGVFAGKVAEIGKTAIERAAAQRATYRLRHDAFGLACVDGAGSSGTNSYSVEAVLGSKDGECADLRGRDLSGADLRQANLNGALLSGADLSNALLSGATLLKADLRGARLRGANLADAVLDEAEMSRADLTSANISSASLKNARLADAVLFNADIKGADFGDDMASETNLSRVDMRGIKADQGSVVKRVYMPGGLLAGADLRGLNFSRAHMKDANLSGADLRGADFSNAYLPGAVLNSADLRGADLSTANLTDAKLRGALYDAKTRLPISRDEARRRGMIGDDGRPRMAPYAPEKGGLSRAEFERVVGRIETAFRPEIEELGMNPSFQRLWENDEEQSDVLFSEGPSGVEPIFRFCGGLARHPRLTEDAYALIVCHEVGHLLAGEPYMRKERGIGFSADGQADYYAAAVCMKRLYANEDNAAAMAGRTVHPVAAERCRSTGNPMLCVRIAMAGLGSTAFLAEKRKVNYPDFSTPSAAVAPDTFIGGAPSPQCRLDTYLAGALEEPRPSCWFAGD